jgi:hypothetical protein
MEAPLSEEPPTLKGYLNKYTNVARGYNTRWFVLKDGVLSCKFFSHIWMLCWSHGQQVTGTKMMRIWHVEDLSP